MKNDNVEIITVNYNTPDLLESCILSCLNNNFDYRNIRIIDGSDIQQYASESKEICNKYSINIEQFGYNIHHGPGMDYAIRTSKFDWILILDSDVKISSDMQEIISEMLSYDKPIVGFCEYVNSDGYNVEGGFEYIHPRFMLINKTFYVEFSDKNNVKFKKHGAPCIDFMSAIHENGFSDKCFGIVPDEKKSQYFATTECGTCSRFGYNLQ